MYWYWIYIYSTGDIVFSDFSIQCIQIFFLLFVMHYITLQDLNLMIYQVKFTKHKIILFFNCPNVEQIHKPQLSFSSVLVRIVLQLLKIVFLSDIVIDFSSQTLFCGKQSEQNMRLVSERNFSILFSVQKSPIVFKWYCLSVKGLRIKRYWLSF